MLKSICALALASLPFGNRATEPAAPLTRPSAPEPTLAAGSVVQTGTVFTGVYEGSVQLHIPVTIDGFKVPGARLLSVDVQLDVRMSGEYVIQPTPVSPDGIVEKHSITTLSLGSTLLADKVAIDFTPIPWVFPVNQPLAVLWALDSSGSGTTTDKAVLREFATAKGVQLFLDVRIDSVTKPAGWADPSFAGVLVNYTVTYDHD